MNQIIRYLDTPDEVFLYQGPKGQLIYLFDKIDSSKYLLCSAFPNTQLIFKYRSTRYVLDPIKQGGDWIRISFEEAREKVESESLDGLLLVDGSCFDIYYSKAKVLTEK